MDNVNTALLPCPFCGSATGYAAPPALGKGRWVIQCDDCRAEGPTSSDNSDAGEAEAITAWNTRATTADLQARLDASEAREGLYREVLAHIAYEAPSGPGLLAHSLLLRTSVPLATAPNAEGQGSEE